MILGVILGPIVNDPGDDSWPKTFKKPMILAVDIQERKPIQRSLKNADGADPMQPMRRAGPARSKEGSPSGPRTGPQKGARKGSPNGPQSGPPKWLQSGPIPGSLPGSLLGSRWGALPDPSGDPFGAAGVTLGAPPGTIVER